MSASQFLISLVDGYPVPIMELVPPPKIQILYKHYIEVLALQIRVKVIQSYGMWKKRERLTPKLVAYLSCYAGCMHFAWTKKVAFLSCFTGCMHFAQTN